MDQDGVWRYDGYDENPMVTETTATIYESA